MKTAITIAGSDSSGGAGIQADIKTMITNGVYAMSAITALTAQNTTGVTSILNATPEFLGQELDSIFTDIYPDAVKIGMVSDKELIKVIAAKLRQYEAKNIVVDPVMVATSGAKLISDDAADTLKEELFPLASVLTPNIPEAEELIGRKITSAEEMIDAAKEISEKYHCAVLCKGGHNLMMRMICCMQMERIDGLTEKELIIRILMVQAVHCLLRLLLILQKDSHWRSLWSVRKSISLGHLQQCLTLGREAVQWIMDLLSRMNIQKKQRHKLWKKNIII